MVGLQQVHDDAPIVVGVAELFRSTAPSKYLLILQSATSNPTSWKPSQKAKRK
jgi:hypothetical protein